MTDRAVPNLSSRDLVATAQVIEAINLFLAGEFPNCVFVLAIEPDMVAAHIEAACKLLVDTLAGNDYWGGGANPGLSLP